jgi:predicted nucleic acid-binding protein
MKHVFLDTSVLLSFSRSKTGGSAYILACCQKGILQGCVSKKVVFEAQKNAAEKMGYEAAKRLNYVFDQGFLTIIPDGTGEAMTQAQKAFNNKKDAPIIAAAKNNPQITFLISLDHGFFKPEVVAFVNPKKIVTPGEFINRFRSELES